MEDYYNLSFKTNLDKVATIKVPRVNESLADSVVKTAMDKIIASGAVDVIQGALISNESAELIKISTRSFSVE